MSSNNALIIFVKNPVLGKVKTRLAKDVGDQNALEVYNGLLKFTRSITDRFEEDKFLFYDDHVDHNDEWHNDHYKKLVQQGDDLGERIKNAFDHVFNQGYDRTCVIGSDCIDLRLDILQMAFRKLDACDAAVGPARDGGYYLIGLKEASAFLFDDMQWSTSDVYKNTVERLEKNFRTYSVLPELKDLDTQEDLVEFMKYQTKFKYQ